MKESYNLFSIIIRKRDHIRIITALYYHNMHPCSRRMDYNILAYISALCSFCILPQVIHCQTRKLYSLNGCRVPTLKCQYIFIGLYWWQALHQLWSGF